MALQRGNRSPAERLAKLDGQERRKALARLSEDEMEGLLYDWRFWARPEQLMPTRPWTTFAMFAGRGSGKTRAAGEAVRSLVESGRYGRVAIIGADAGDVRDVMLEGESGLLAISPPWCMPKWEPSKRRVTWPNGATGSTFGAHDPDALRGPQSDLMWCDEIAKWKHATEAWDNAVLGNRLGDDPKRIVTSTPKPIKLVRMLMGRDRASVPDESVVLAPTMTTYDNLGNLAAPFVRDVLKKYQGTRLGRQELMGELLMDVPGALWTLDLIEKGRVRPHEAPALSDFVRIVVAIDPAVTSDDDSNETGIIVAGRTWNEHYYVLEDGSGRHTGYEWATEAVRLFRLHRADRIVAEVNNGGDLVEAQIRVVDKNVPYTAVHASRGKRTRGEPVAALYEQGRVHHVGAFDALEDQMITWIPDAGEESPDRADALVWALTELSDYQETAQLPPTSTSRNLR